MTINLSYLIQVFNLYPLVAYVCGLGLSVGNTDLLRQLGGLPGETVRQNHLKPRMNYHSNRITETFLARSRDILKSGAGRTQTYVNT